jgi:2-hydroxycyclohexanecarboxyl-CoA dehydrogenase
MTERLSDRVAIVTGAGQGIGRAIALSLARNGAAVTLVGRTPAKVEKVAEEIAGAGGTAITIACDVGGRENVASMVRTTVDAFGTVDILINNAQDSVQRLLADTTDEDVDRAYRTGPMATLYAMQACLPYLKRKGGSVVNFGSSSAITGAATFGSYAMAKEAIRGLTRVAAREWGRYGIRVNTVCPATLTPSTEKWAAEHPERYAAALAQIPLGRMGDPESDIGPAVAALVSDDFRYMTGATLVLEGGRITLG